MNRSQILIALVFFIAGLIHSTAFAKTTSTLTEKKLIVAAESGDLVQVKNILKDKKNNINAKDSTGATALMLAAINGNEDIVGLLIHNNAQLELKSNEGETALTFAISNDQPEIAKKLVLAGADTNIKMAGDEGDNVLAKSILGDSSLSQLLIKKNPTLVNQKNKLGETPLFVAARYGTDKEIEFLIKNGADISIKNNEGKTALTVAKEANNNLTQKALTTKSKKKAL